MVLGALVIVITGILVVNYFKGKDVSNKLPEIAENKTEAVIGQTYTVQANDNLWTIAEKAYGSGYNWVDIASENNLANADTISEGMELVIPDIEPKTPTMELTDSENSSENTTAITETTYQVQKGDNLWDICVRAYGDGYRWVEVAQVNDLANPDLIHSGNVLILPR